MKHLLSLSFWCLLGQALFFTPATFAESPKPSSILYENANLLHTSRGEQTANAYMLVTDGRFTYVGTERPDVSEDTEVVNLAGGYVTPGFIDTHAHISLGAVSFTIEGNNVEMFADNQLEIAKWNAQKMLEFGITSIRNPGGDTRANLAYKNAQQSGTVIGPRAFVAGSIINTIPFTGLAVGVDNAVSIREAVGYQAEQGVDFIKLYTGLDAEQISLAAAEAKRWELPVIGHLESVSWQVGAERGVNHLVHAMPVSPDLLPAETREEYLAQLRPGNFNWFEWYAAADFESAEVESMIAALVEHNTSVDPTLIVFYNAFYGNQPGVTEHPELMHAHPELVENWRTFFHFNIGWEASDFDKAQQVWPNVQAFVKRLHDEGVLLTVGTDLGNPWVIPGVSYFQEMELLADAGISAFEVLKLATSNGAQVLERDHELGHLAEGYIADFVVFSENPAQDISNLHSIQKVIQNGTVNAPAAISP